MFCCLEHVEDAMDRLIDDQEKLPELFSLDEVHSCEFCENAAMYRVAAGVEIHEDINEGEI